MKLVGLDLGTSTIKAVLFEVGQQVEVQQVCAVPHPLSVPAPDRAEQDPALALTLTRQVLDGIRWTGVQAVGVSGAMHSLLPLSVKGEPLLPAWTWADLRATAQARALRRTDPTLASRTGTPVHPMAWPAKLLWLAQHHPGLPVARFTGLKEYVLEQLTGRAGLMDRGMASGTGCYDWALQAWEGDRFPEVVEADALWGEVRGIPLVAGGGDGPLSNLGSGVLDDSQAAVSLGTSGAVRLTRRGPVADPSGRTFCYHLVGDLWVQGGAISNGTVTLDWLARLLNWTGTNAELVETAWSPEAEAHGLTVLPYLAGERAPHWNPDARGVFLGLALHHQPAHLVRALLESIAFALKDVFISLEMSRVRQVRVSGGLTGSAPWTQLLCDVLEVPVATVVSPESAALGAALIAGRAVGLQESPELPLQARFEPRSQPRLREAFLRYQGVYQALQGYFP